MLISLFGCFWKWGGKNFIALIYNAKTWILVGMWEFWLKYLILNLKKFPLDSHRSHWIVKILFSSLFLNVKYCVNLVGIVGICLKSNWYWLKMAVFCPKKAGKFPLNSRWCDFCWRLAAGWCPIFTGVLWFGFSCFAQFYCVKCEILCYVRNFIVLVRSEKAAISGCLNVFWVSSIVWGCYTSSNGFWGVGWGFSCFCSCIGGNDFGWLFLGCHKS